MFRCKISIFRARFLSFSLSVSLSLSLSLLARCVASTRNFITPSNSALRACRSGFTTGLVHRKDVRMRAVRRRAASLRRVVKMERSCGLTICIERDEQRRKFIQTSAGSTTNSRTTQGLLTELNVEEDPACSANCTPSDAIKRNGALNERDRFSIRRRLSRCSLKYTAEMEVRISRREFEIVHPTRPIVWANCLDSDWNFSGWKTVIIIWP